MKRGLRRMGSVAWLVVLVAFPLFGAKHPFSVTLKAPTKPLKAGTRVWLRVTLTNTSGRNITFMTSPGPVPMAGRDYRVKILDARGRRAPALTSAGALGTKGERWVYISRIAHTLKPGESLQEKINVAKYFDLTQPGVYSIRVTRRFQSWQHFGKGGVRSNIIAVTLIK